ncbi:hypothetical protein KIW84_065508 [Lathyrus oleraceus]|uniref:MHD domain-containing protein n=1 Tax=Pisum sativum TaxID=3888 RepID=A0A9D4WEI5_PEA|nr:hypothetical protein KIW84_065508 [Pisum sativum]
MEDIIEDLEEIAIGLPGDIKLAVAAIARRRKLLSDDVLIALADASWEILDVSGSDVSDFGLIKAVERCETVAVKVLGANSRQGEQGFLTEVLSKLYQEARVNFELEPGTVGHTTDFKEANKRLKWGIKKVVGGSEHTLRAKLTFSQELHGNIMKEVGPLSMTFTIPMYNSSRLQVKHLQIAKKSRWNC